MSCWIFKMPHPFQIFSQLDYLIQTVDINSHTELQTVQIQISWLLRSQLIWIYTVCKGRVYLGSAGQGLNIPCGFFFLNCLYFLIKHILWILTVIASLREFQWVPTRYNLAQIFLIFHLSDLQRINPSRY